MAEPRDGPDLGLTLMCPDCRIYPPELIERTAEGDVMCANCGLVLGSRIIDTRSEWRTFSNDDQAGDDPSRVGNASNPLLDGDQLSTTISFMQTDSRLGRDLSRAQNKSALDKKDHALQVAYAKISQKCEQYHLPKIVQDAAKDVYKLVYDDNELRGKSQESLMAAAIFIGCRKSNVARTFQEIWALTNVPRKEIGKVFKIINRKYYQNNIRSTTGHNEDTAAVDLIRRYSSHLGLPLTTSNLAEQLAKRSVETGVLAGRSPITIAATSIYMATELVDEQVPLSKISERTGISDGTIKTSFRVLFENCDKILTEEMVRHGKVKQDKLPNEWVEAHKKVGDGNGKAKPKAKASSE